MILSSILVALGASTAQKYVDNAATKGRQLAGDSMTDAIGQVGKLARAGIDTRKQSLVSYSSPGRIEPVCYVDADCADSPMLPSLLQAELSVFAGYWLRAFSLNNTTIGEVSVASRLERFATHRAPDYLGAIGLESMDSFLQFDKKLLTTPKVFTEHAALEAASIRDPQAAPAATEPTGNQVARTLIGSPQAAPARSNNGNVRTIDDFADEANLAIGKIFNVEVVEGQARATVPVIIRMNVMFVPTETMVHIYTSSSQDIGVTSRTKQWWNGRIDFWRDLVMSQDLIDAHKKNLRNDQSGFYQMMLKRRSDNVNAALVSGVPSAAASSTIIIMSKATAEDIGSRLGGKISDFAIRQRFFEQGYAMLMAVIDDSHGSVRLYTRDIAEYSDVNARALEASARGTGPNVGDILSAFRAGQSPIL